MAGTLKKAAKRIKKILKEKPKGKKMVHKSAHKRK